MKLNFKNYKKTRFFFRACDFFLLYKSHVLGLCSHVNKRSYSRKIKNGSQIKISIRRKKNIKESNNNYKKVHKHIGPLINLSLNKQSVLFSKEKLIFQTKKK